jgi:enoyl-CoA hydratase/carnithine racemase
MFGDASFETLICDTPAEGVARITLNRPASMNAYTLA